MIRVIDIESKSRTPLAEGHGRNVLAPADEGTRVRVAIEEVDAGKTYRVAASDRTQVAYLLEGTAEIAHSSGGRTAQRTAHRRSGVYLEPGEEASLTASGAPLKVLVVTVPMIFRPFKGAVASGAPER